MRLIGVAENQVQGLADRIAMVVEGDDELHFLREGDTLANRYRVQWIGEEVVRLADLMKGSEHYLPLAR